MSKPIVYSWDDPGSPGRNLTGNKQNRIKQILKACLVDGYGDKPAAGWDMVHEHPNGFSMTNGFGTINIVSDVRVFGQNVGNNYVSVFLAEGVYDTSNAILGANNIVSCGNTANSHHRIPVMSTLETNLNSLRWSVYADSKTAILLLFSTYTNTGGAIYFGEFNSHLGKDNFIVMGGSQENSSSNSANFTSLHTSVTSLRDLETGLITDKFTDFYGLPYGTDRNAENSHYLPHDMTIPTKYFDFTRIPIALDQKGIIGTLRGMLFSPLLYRTFYVLPNSFPITGMANADYATNPIDLGDGYLTATTFSWRSNVSVTNNEEYW